MNVPAECRMDRVRMVALRGDRLFDAETDRLGAHPVAFAAAG
jgi:hypothetical protein